MNVAKLYFQGASCAFLVFDVTNRTSFENTSKWLAKIKECCHPSVILSLLGNKSDLAAQRTVTYNEAAQFARQNGMNYLEVSAKTSRNVASAFHLVL